MQESPRRRMSFRSCAPKAAALAALLAAGAWYVSDGRASAEPVSTPPRPLTAGDFEYPALLWDARIEGEVMLRVLVSASGGADSVLVERGSGYAAFDSAATAAARTQRFAPATHDGEPEDQWVLIPVRFDLDAHADPADAAP